MNNMALKLYIEEVEELTKKKEVIKNIDELTKEEKKILSTKLVDIEDLYINQKSYIK